MKNCCNHGKKDKQCIRKSDKKTFKLPRRFSKKKCRKPKGFTMKSSCAPYKDCFKKTKRKQKGGDKKKEDKKKNKISYFSAGCFWGVEEKFSKLDGVINTLVGYMGGKTNNPTYEKVSNGNTGHAETVKIVYNSSVIDYNDLVKLFFTIHDPTTKNEQGVDIGKQYRSIAFYKTKDEKDILLSYKKKNKKIVTELLKSTDYKFYKAEKYHQRYVDKKKPILTENKKIFNEICINNQNNAEIPFSGKYSKKPYKLAIKTGIYICPICKNNLYHSDDIYDSKSGWPAFSDTIDGYKKSEVVSFNKKTLELKCAKCELHLGHRLHDGPTKTKIHDCINSVCLHFKPIKISKEHQKKKDNSTKKKFLYNPKNPKKSFDVYIDKNPKDTIPIKYKTLQDVKNTIKKLERLYKTNKYPHTRIWKVGMILKVRLEALKGKKPQHFKLANRYFKFLGKRTKIKTEKERKKLKFDLK